MWVRKLWNDERILNLVSKFKLDKVCPPSWQKNNWQKTRACHFHSFWPKRGSNISKGILGSNAIRFKFWDQLWNLLIIPELSNPIFGRICTFWFYGLHSRLFPKFESHWADQKEHFWENKLYHVDQREKMHQNRGAHVEKLKKMKSDEP